MILQNSPRLAIDGYIWVCTACGKTIKDKYGPGLGSTPQGWDASCVLNAVLVAEENIDRSGGEHSRVDRVDKIAFDPHSEDFLNMPFDDIERFLTHNGYDEKAIDNVIAHIRGMTLARAVAEANGITLKETKKG